MRRLDIIFLIPAFFFLSTGFYDVKEYNVLDFGARADGKTLNTESIQKAIDVCSKNGGGTVYFPAGKFLTGTVYFRNNVTIYLDNGAEILGSTNLKDYPENYPDYQFYRKGKIKRALIYAENKENISIKGRGTIDGQGADVVKENGEPVQTYGERPHVIWMIRSKNIKIEGIRLQNSALWMQHYLACKNLYIHDVDVYNHANKNNDMMDINGCKDVIISDCRGDTDDDGITIKSTHAMPSENITITNCLISSHCNAIKCGTESNAGFKNITISNCIIRPSKDKESIYGRPEGISGISLEVVDGAEMNGVNISDIVIDGPRVPIFVRLGNRARGYDKNLPRPRVGSIENISISNIIARNADVTGCSITGIPEHPVKNIMLENIRISFKRGGKQKDSEKVIPEYESNYPESTMFGRLPSYGFFVRHAKNITMNNMSLEYQSIEERPAFILEDVIEARLSYINAQREKDIPLIRLINTKKIRLIEVKSITDVRLEKTKNKDIVK